MFTENQWLILGDYATADAKKMGHRRATAWHLVDMIRRRYPDGFQFLFGSRGKALLAQADPVKAVGLGAAMEQVKGMEGARLGRALAAFLQPEGEIDSADTAVTLPVAPRPCPGAYKDILADVVDQLTSQSVRPVLIHTPRGVPTTEIAEYLAAEFTEPVTRLNPHLLEDFTSCYPSFIGALNQGGNEGIVVLDCAEALFGLASGPRVNADAAAAILTHLAAGGRFPLIVLPAAVEEPTKQLLGALMREAVIVTLPAPTSTDIATLARHHGQSLDLPVDSAVYPLVLSPPVDADNFPHPALAYNRLDKALRTAHRAGAKSVGTQHVHITATSNIHVRAEELIAQVSKQVRGQDHAVELTARRLTLTYLNMDLNPERPNGVFLFAGPSGVGKTQTAKALCEAIYGDSSRLLRLDMSEYHEDWSISRLTGPQPGYVGADNPDSWLTTKVRRQPHTVILLDEIEKAHPQVWNIFLQVFDAGRLTDSTGEVADFSNTVIIMTSNLGATSMNVGSLGFGDGDHSSLIEVSQQRVLEAVKKNMAPELVNRMDEIIAFRPLSTDIIRSIAAAEVERLGARLSSHGYTLHVTDAVLDHLATEGYEPAFGARHVQRAIERNLLIPLPELPPGEITADVVDGRIVLIS